MQSSMKLFTDGGSRGNPGPAAYAYVLFKMDDSVVEKHGKYLGITTNNQAEYQGLIAGLKKANTLDVSDLQIFMDSELIVRQMQGAYKVKNKELIPLYTRAKKLAEKINEISFIHVARALNSEADSEVNRVLDEAEN